MDKILILNKVSRTDQSCFLEIVFLVSMKYLLSNGFDMSPKLSLIHMLGAKGQNLSSLYFRHDKNGYSLCTRVHFVDIGCKNMASQH